MKLSDLNQQQQHALGKKGQQIPNFIWNKKMGKVYTDFIQDNLEEDGQTFHEFLQMEKLQPNEQGTGRYKFSKYSKITLIFIQDEKFNKIQTQIIPKLERLISLYLKIPVFYNRKIKMRIKQNKIVDYSRKLQYSVSHWKNCFNAYDILDILMQYKQQNQILVALLQKNIHQQKEVLDGRATGDGVAVISYEQNQLQGEKLQIIFQCVLHEILHTLGFDHCIAWKCLMNAITTFTTWLCPACSRKLYHQLCLNNRQSVTNWISSLLTVLYQFKFLKSYQMGRQIISTFSKLTL